MSDLEPADIAPSSWAFYAIGEPQPQGSKNAWVPKNGNRAILYDQNAKTLKPWRGTVTSAASGQGLKLEGPVAVRMIFTMKRPKSAPKSYSVPSRSADLDKLARAVGDAITDAGLWVDDKLVVEFRRLAKVFPGFGAESLPVPGVVVAACEMTEGWSGKLLTQLAFEACKAAWDKYSPSTQQLR